MSKRKRYTDDFRASAVLMLEAAGYTGDQETSKIGSLTAVSNKLSVPISTLRGWFNKTRNPPPAELREEKKRNLLADLKELLGLHIDLSAKLAGEGLEGLYEADIREVNTGIGILVDKIQLLSGKPTERTETRHVLDDLQDDEYQEVIAEAERVLGID